MLNFLENHDEQRIASDFFAGDPWLILPALVVSATLTNAPFMVYFGQELGERGMDAEGFSGCDGRTSIFDYWGIESIQQWLNKGKFDNKGLSNDQLNLRDYYQRLINLLVTQPAIREGKMYDLQYANYNRSGYNPHRQFSFFRHHETQLILIVANFDQHPVNVSLHIPVDALNYLHIQENTLVSYKDLLKPDDNKHSLILSSRTPVEIAVEANSAVVLMLELG
jgi:glycosidase